MSWSWNLFLMGRKILFGVNSIKKMGFGQTAPSPCWFKFSTSSANTPWLVTGYGKYGLIFCTWRILVMEKFEFRRGEAEPNFKFFHNPYSPSAEYEAIFSITRHQPGGICTNILHIPTSRAQRAHKHPPTDTYLPIVGRIYPISEYFPNFWQNFCLPQKLAA